MVTPGMHDAPNRITADNGNAPPAPPSPFGIAGGNATPGDCRPDAQLQAHEEAIATAMALHVTEHGKIALSYSGGAESGLLLHLLRPFRQWFTVLWVNAGALPHEAEHVRREAEGGPFAEIASDRAAFWQKHGLPSTVVPAWRMTAFASDVPMTGPPISPMRACCAVVRTLPGNDWLAANGVTLFIHGQRQGEGSGMFAALPAPWSSWAPLARWSRAEVMRRVAHHGVRLPLQYAEGYPETIECAVCPANMDPARLAFLRRHYPAEHADAVRLAGDVLREVAPAFEAQRRALAEAEEAAP